MKKIKFLATLLAAGALVACNETIEPQGSGENTPTTGEGYVKVAINMPTTSGDMTKVDDSGIFDDGLESEYAVKSAALVFFKASSTLSATPESEAIFVKAYDVTTSLAGEGGSDNQVTNRHIVLNEAPMAGDGEQIYALAILNYTSLFTVTAGGALQMNNADVFSNENNKLAALQTKVETSVNIVADNATKGKGFLMTNSPLATTSTQSEITDLTKVRTLVPVTVYAEETTAENSEAASIYVERVVAKVTLKGFAYSATDGYTKDVKTENGDAFEGDKVKMEGWVLNVTNKSTNIVRNVDDITIWCNNTYGTDNRFLGTTKIDNKNLFRIYWGKDHNYDVAYINLDDASAQFNIYNNESSDIPWNTNAEHDNSSSPLYCLENTMKYDCQNENQTTTLLLKTTYIADPNSDDQNFFMVGNREETYTVDSFKELVKNTLSLGSDVVVNVTDPNGGVYIYNGQETAGNNDIRKILTGLTKEQANSLYNALGAIKFYKEGASYYNTVLIRHFSDDTDVDWDASEPNYGTKHLGRYGVLRNNWYEINVSSISGPGEPEIPDPGTDPNDNTEGYIRAEINVLSWAKRSQDVDL